MLGVVLMLKYCECGSLIIKGNCSNRGCSFRAEKDKIKRKNWLIGDTKFKSNEFLTYDEAFRKHNKFFTDEKNRGKRR
jgi:hypothetical protein